MIASDIIGRARISDLVAALGGGPIRRGRVKAWWRNGDGFNVALDDSKGTWFDHARGEGGGILDLIRAARSCSRADALGWLADYLGMPLQQTTPKMRLDWQQERAEALAAQFWGSAAAAFAETALEELHSEDPERSVHSRLLRIVRDGGAALVEEYCEWQSAAPELTAAMVKAGRASDSRLQRGLAALIVEWGAVNAAA
jgi:hypothetical protein